MSTKTNTQHFLTDVEADQLYKQLANGLERLQAESELRGDRQDNYARVLFLALACFLQERGILEHLGMLAHYAAVHSDEAARAFGLPQALKHPFNPIPSDGEHQDMTPKTARSRLRYVNRALAKSSEWSHMRIHVTRSPGVEREYGKYLLTDTHSNTLKDGDKNLAFLVERVTKKYLATSCI